ncbi:serine/threonine-protein kinase [Streptomyces sp. ZAF1911]|uniref:serine/threonine-protein kinase n=1 Tax=Streptomyces sp. ZAF1911 TaxID=2944129 RepID=UPI00237C118F|nr:serine/threonine-protein kinase [Streptomyces sp. ZAF1911]MDD9378103.1 serine/threonine-protein kinase [Streptomyces sp. ZAF1911]
MREQDVLVERYELTGLLGRGGFGEVWRAFDTRVRRTVAVKIGHPRSAEDRERFASEAHLAGTLVHPCIAALYDYGEAQYEGQPLVYLVMELVEGETLAAVLRRGVPPTASALVWARDVCEALGAAHERNVVHRDIKALNVMITGHGGPGTGTGTGTSTGPGTGTGTGTGRAKVLDFGIAKYLHQPGLTATGYVIGSFEYMAPERLLGAPAVDGRADLYALGCLLMQLLTGQLPFPAQEVEALSYAHAHTPPPLPSSLRPGLPPGADRLVLDLLAKDPAGRPAGAAEVIDRLNALIRGDEEPPAGQNAAAHDAAHDAAGRTATDPRRTRDGTRPASPQDTARPVLAARLDRILASGRTGAGPAFVRQLDLLIGDLGETLGADDPLTAEAGYHRAMYLWQSAGDPTELERVLPRLLGVLGPEDRRTIDVQAVLAGAAAARGQVDGRPWLPVLREVIERSTRVLGADSEITLVARLDLAEALDREYDGRARPLAAPRERTPEQAARRRDLLAPLLPDLVRGLGPDDPRVRDVTLRLALDSYGLGAYREALPYYEQLVPSSPAGLARTPVGLRIQHAHCVAESGDPRRAVALLDAVRELLYTRGDARSVQWDKRARALRSEARKMLRQQGGGGLLGRLRG